MRKILFTLTALMVLYSCSTTDNPVDEMESTNPKEYTVSLGFAGEITNITDSPLTRAATTDLYGIQVYSKPTTSGAYQPYAYGVFNDKSKMTIKLLGGYTYKFISTMVVNGQNLLMYYFFIGNDNKFGTLDNTFYNSNSSYLYADNSSSLWLKSEGKMVPRANIDRYYGETEGYIPAENGSVSINMKRVVFGAKFIADGLTEGKLNISINEAPALHITYGEATEVQDIFTFKNPYPYGLQWTQDNYSETMPVSITWEKADGAVVPLITQDITFKRNMLTTITVKVKDNSTNNGVTLSQDSTAIGVGDNITIDTGTGIVTGINPQ